MAGFWGIRREQRPAVSADFERALTQEVLRTELIRIKAILVTLSVLLAMTIAVTRFRRTLD